MLPFVLAIQETPPYAYNVHSTLQYSSCRYEAGRMRPPRERNQRAIAPRRISSDRQALKATQTIPRPRVERPSSDDCESLPGPRGRLPDCSIQKHRTLSCTWPKMACQSANGSKVSNSAPEGANPKPAGAIPETDGSKHYVKQTTETQGAGATPP